MRMYFYFNGEEKEGPLTLEELKLKDIQPKTLIWYEGLDDWTPAGDVADMNPILEISPPSILSEKNKEPTEIERNTAEASEYRNEQLYKYKGVGGWLLLLCFALTIGSPLRTLYNLMNSYNESSQYFQQFPRLQYLLYVDGFLGLFLMVLSIRAGSALWNVKPGAVKIAKNYFMFFLGYSIFAVFAPFTVGFPSEVNDALIPEVAGGAMQSLFYFGIWYMYLNQSKRVKATYLS
jgi:hypothetical protein